MFHAGSDWPWLGKQAVQPACQAFEEAPSKARSLAGCRAGTKPSWGERTPSRKCWTGAVAASKACKTGRRPRIVEVENSQPGWWPVTPLSPGNDLSHSSQSGGQASSCDLRGVRLQYASQEGPRCPARSSLLALVIYLGRSKDFKGSLGFRSLLCH